MIDRSGADPDTDVSVVARLRHGKVVTKLDAIEPTVSGDGESSHACGLGLYLTRMLRGGVRARKARGH